MNRFKKFFVAAAVTCSAGLCALAADGDGGGSGTAISAVNDAMTGWIADVKATMATWAGSLAPLYTLGITILLLVVAWRLFKRITKSSS